MGVYKIYKEYGTKIHTYTFNPKEERFAYEYGVRMKLETIDKLPRPNADEDVACVTNWNFFDWVRSFDGYGEIEQDGVQKQQPSINFPSFSFKDNLLTFADIPNAQIGAGVGYVLILEGKKNIINVAKVSTKKDAQTALCQTYNGEILIAVVEGDDTKKRGTSANEMADFLLRLGARIAFMGDSGGSSSMMIDGKFVYHQGRAIACGLVVYKKKTNKYIVWVNKLNIRESPGILKNNIVSQYKKNDIVEVLEERSLWVRTNKGWIYKSYIKKF